MTTIKHWQEALEAITTGDTMTSVINYIQSVEEQGFWGFLSLKFESGKIVHIRREENLRVDSLPERNRRQNGNAQR
jgi:hypothetical protein